MRLIIALCLFAVAAAAPVNNAPDYDGRYNNYNDIKLLNYENDNDGLGPFHYRYEQTDGQRAEARGIFKNEGLENESLDIEGSYSWLGPDGVIYTIKYNADENGFHPEIEQGPGGAIPSAVLASLAG